VAVHGARPSGAPSRASCLALVAGLGLLDGKAAKPSRQPIAAPSPINSGTTRSSRPGAAGSSSRSVASSQRAASRPRAPTPRAAAGRSEAGARRAAMRGVGANVSRLERAPPQAARLDPIEPSSAAPNVTSCYADTEHPHNVDSRRHSCHRSHSLRSRCRRFRAADTSSRRGGTTLS